MSTSSNLVRIVEVGPRDGLQNEKAVISPSVKVELINRLGHAGLKSIEAGSFVSPKWVPQMAGTSEVLAHMEKIPGVHYPVLVPNQKGLEALFSLSDSSSPSSSSSKLPTDEIAIFTAATDEFSRANTNCSVAESLARLRPVAAVAIAHGLRVRGYVSVVITCPYSGKVDPRKVREVTKELIDMGCYEVSLGDTNGTGTPSTVRRMIEEVASAVPVSKLAGHFHDTYGMAIANVMTALSLGVRTIDSSIGGLGGCPYSPGATGNVATEDVLHAIQAPDSGYEAEGDMNALVDIGFWISEQLGRDNVSRAGKAYRAARLRMERENVKERSNL
ncbi:aldolase [Schizopora paradoxa]|uniref:hydroxymethylglutaryl-CoA lyase n=1 Tax=Schizopora paradoxa TaxID=27342 RepID=A0A0H2RKW5_9AGAM|nr:aldolase [Schizopora paradoxa]